MFLKAVKVVYMHIKLWEQSIWSHISINMRLFLCGMREDKGKKPTGIFSWQNVPFMFIKCYVHVHWHMLVHAYTRLYFMWSSTRAPTHLHLTSLCLEQALCLSDSSTIQVSAQMSLLLTTVVMYCKHVPNLHSSLYLYLLHYDFAAVFIRMWSFSLPLETQRAMWISFDQ